MAMCDTPLDLCSHPVCFNKSVQNLVSAVFHPPELVRSEHVSCDHCPNHKEEFFFYSSYLLTDGLGRCIHQHSSDSLLPGALGKGLLSD